MNIGHGFRLFYLVELTSEPGNYLVANYGRRPFLFSSDISLAAHFFSRAAAGEVSRSLGIASRVGMSRRVVRR